jgi:hypothetical protein
MFPFDGSVDAALQKGKSRRGGDLAMLELVKIPLIRQIRERSHREE